MREAPAITIINRLLQSGAKVAAYDPKAFDSAYEIFGDSIDYVNNNYETLNGADALILLTEWNEFRRPDFDKIKNLMKYPVIFDGRNQYEPKRMVERGFRYFCVGKQTEEVLVKN
jgi:UDPglucose 6-dehydrogenase